MALDTPQNLVREQFLLRDAMHKRGLCRRAVSVRPSVCPSATFVYSVAMSKHIFKIFHHPVATPFYFFNIKRFGNIPTGTPKGPFIAISDTTELN